MKRIALILSVVALAGATGCADDAVSPPLSTPGALTAASLAAPPATAADQGIIWNDVGRYEVDGPHWVPCANGGAGEDVWFEGLILVNERLVSTPGGYNYRFQITPQGLTGTGEVTGDVYQDVGGLREHFIGGDGPTLVTISEVHRMVPRGPGDIFLQRFDVTVRITPGGETVVERVEQSISCS